jgi:ubiquitin-conjugating enzyme E2 D/E
MADEKTRALIAIQNEFKDLNRNPLANIGATVGLVNTNNFFEWTATLLGPSDTSYAQGLFILRIKFPNNYPQKRPEVCFSTPIYHINVNPRKAKSINEEPLGHVCISTLNWWKPTNKIREVLSDIFALFYMANPKSPYGLNRADEFMNNR